MKKHKISYACATHIGNVRKENQDNFYIDNKTAKCDGIISGVLENARNITAVCDGMGGEANGKEAAELVAERIRQADEILQSGGDIDAEKIVLNYIDSANGDVYKMSEDTGRRGGSTVNIVYTSDDFIRSYNLGDSKTYLYRHESLIQLSKDHTTVAELVNMGAISKEEARVHPRRNQINQYVGMPPERFEAVPHIQEEKLYENDIILICSDGLTDMCGDSEISLILSMLPEAGEKNGVELEKTVNKLIERALDKRGSDNITIILLFFGGG